MFDLTTIKFYTYLSNKFGVILQMTDIKKRNRAYWFLIISSFLLYVIMTGAKNVYTAEMSLVGKFFGVDKATVSSTMQYYFYTYAGMQLLLVPFMKKLNIKWYLVITISISAVITIVVGLTTQLWQITILYTVNGAFQAGIWGCLVKHFANYLPQRLLPKANKILTIGIAVASALSYLCAAVFASNWKLPFFILGGILVVCIVLFFLSTNYVKKFPKEAEPTHHVVHSDGTEEDVLDEAENDFIHLTTKKRRIVFYAISLVVSLVCTALYFMGQNWMPNMLQEVFGLPDNVSLYITVLAPICITIGPVLTVNSCEKHKNFVAVGIVYFGISCLFALLLFLFYDKNLIVTIILLLCFLITSNGARMISLSTVSMRLRTSIEPGTYTTFVNAAASVTAGLGPFIFGSIIDASGWGTAYLTLLIANVALVLILIGTFFLIKFANKNKKFD